MYYSDIANILADRKRKLGMSEAYIADVARLSQPTVHRILSGKHKKAAWDDVVNIAVVLGLNLNQFSIDGKIEFMPVEEMKERQAETLARMRVAMTNSTNQLEGQGIDPEEKNRLIFEAKIRMLRQGHLWG